MIAMDRFSEITEREGVDDIGWQREREPTLSVPLFSLSVSLSHKQLCT